jgi:hypothetical protein
MALIPRLLRKNSLIFKRKAKEGDGLWDDNGIWVDAEFWQDGQPGYWTDTGDWVNGDDVLIPTKGNLQPFKQGKERIDLPEGIRSSEVKIYYTTTKLETADDHENGLPDETIIDNVVYEVYDVEDWDTPAYRSKNYKVFLVRGDKM